MVPGECISKLMFGPWTIRDGEVKAGKEEGPSGWSGVKSPGLYIQDSCGP